MVHAKPGGPRLIITCHVTPSPLCRQIFLRDTYTSSSWVMSTRFVPGAHVNALPPDSCRCRSPCPPSRSYVPPSSHTRRVSPSKLRGDPFSPGTRVHLPPCPIFLKVSLPRFPRGVRIPSLGEPFRADCASAASARPKTIRTWTSHTSITRHGCVREDACATIGRMGGGRWFLLRKEVV